MRLLSAIVRPFIFAYLIVQMSGLGRFLPHFVAGTLLLAALAFGAGYWVAK